MNVPRNHSEFDRLHTTNYHEFHDNEDTDDDEGGAAPPSYQHGAEAWFPSPAAAAAAGATGVPLPSSNHPSPSRKLMGGQGPPDHEGGGGVILHMVPESSKSRWSHIEDLDSFFKKVYEYHQRHGFKVMVLQKFCDLAQVLFVILLTSYLWECVDYEALFTNRVEGRGGEVSKVYIDDVFYTPRACAAHFSYKVWIYLVVACSLWLWKALAVFYAVFQYWDIKSFYNQALKISDAELDSVTWQEVQKRLVEAQSDYLMCIHKEQLTELDIYHRILRFKNYLVAMVNKDLLPVRFARGTGYEFLFLSQGLKWNYEFLLFAGPWAPFDKWHLKEDYRKVSKRKDLTNYLQGKIALVAILNFVLMPLILFWQILYSFFNYAELIKREPGSLGVRRWSQYGKLYLRHFNEHDHELKSRLSRAYKPANQYMDIFVSPVMAVIARFVCFIAGSLLAVLILLTVWDEDVLNVDHLLTVITLLTCVVGGSRLFIPDPNMVFNPEKTLTAVLAHIHYFPDAWKGQAHTPRVMLELGELFPYTAIVLLHELLSPVITPFVLMFYLRPKAGQIVDFFRNFTVDIVGVGDVCSFAQMDVRKHGNPAWQATTTTTSPTPTATAGAAGNTAEIVNTSYTQAEDGKTEMSLVNFTLTNPQWKPPQDSESFIAALRGQAARDAEALPTLAEEGVGVGAAAHAAAGGDVEDVEVDDSNALCASLHSLEAAGGVYAEIAQGVFAQAAISQMQHHRSNSSSQHGHLMMTSATGNGSLLQSVHQGLNGGGGGGGGGGGFGRSSIFAASSHHLRPSGGGGGASAGAAAAAAMAAAAETASSSIGASMLLAPPPNLRQDLRRLGLEYTAADMSLSALYLHELHHRVSASVTRPSSSSRSTTQQQVGPFHSQSGLANRRSTAQPYRQTSLLEEEEESRPLVPDNDVDLDPRV